MQANAFVDALLNLVGNGGFYVLLLLIALSIWATAIIVERILFYRATLPAIDAGVEQARQQLVDGISDGWQPGELGALGDLYDTLWTRPGSITAQHARLDDAVGELRRSLMHRTSILGTLGANTPFIGLLGTVFGIIQAFRDLAETTGKGADAVMGGIAEALVATGLGLLVAIPCVLFYNYFARRTALIGERVTEVGRWLVAERPEIDN